MCGIICTVNTTRFSRDSSNFLRDGIVTGAVRGQDSIGMLQVDWKNAIYVHKKAVSGSAFLTNKIAEAFVTDAEKCRVTMVHHRAATMGKISDDNAHPFVCDKLTVDPTSKKPHVLVGVHNGSLTNWKTKPGAKHYDVDSEWALNHIAQRGAEAFKDITGPYCFMWVDQTAPGKLFVTRNKDRPMHAIMSKDKTEVFFASEAGMLAWLVERNRINVEDDIMVIGDNHIYEFDLNGTTVKITAHDRPAAPVMHDSTSRAVTVASPAVTNTKNSHGINTEGQLFIDKVKLAAKGELLDPPATPVTKPAVSEETAQMLEDIRNAQGTDIVPWSEDDDGYFVADQVPTAWYNDGTASEEEKKKATKLDMFRSMEWFQGVEYDNDTNELLGEIEVWTKADGKVSHVAIMRGISRARASSQYINGKVKGDWTVVIGAREDSQLGLIYIVTELNNYGRLQLDKQKATSN